MMKNVFVLIVIMFVTVGIYAQPVLIEKIIDSAYREGDYSEVARNAENLSVLDTIDWITYYRIGASFLNLYELNKALYFLEKADSLFPNNTQIIKTIGKCQQAKGAIKKAIVAYEQCLSMDTRNHYPRIQIANILEEQGEYNKALQQYLFLLKKDTSNYYFNKKVARCYRKMDSIDMAIHHYTIALRENPDDLLSASTVINLLLGKREFNKAAEIADAVLLIDSTDVRIIKQKAYINYIIDNYIQSTIWFKKAIEYKDTSKFTWKYLGLSYYKDSYYDSAVTALTKAYLIDTSDVEVVYFIGVAYGSLLEEEKGLEFLNKAKELIIPTKKILINVYSKLGELHNAVGQYNNALVDYLTPHSFYPDDPVLLFYIAIQYDYMLKYDKALKYYERFLNSTSDTFETEIPDGMTISYNEYARKRVSFIKEELFFRGEWKE